MEIVTERIGPVPRSLKVDPAPATVRYNERLPARVNQRWGAPVCAMLFRQQLLREERSHSHAVATRGMRVRFGQLTCWLACRFIERAIRQIEAQLAPPAVE